MSKRQRVVVRQVTDRATGAREMGHDSDQPVYVHQLQCQCTHTGSGGLVSRCVRRITDASLRSGCGLCGDCRPSLIASTAVGRQMFVQHCDVSAAVSAFVRRIESAPPQQRAVAYRCIRRFNASLAPQCACSCVPCTQARGVCTMSWSWV